MQYSPLHQKLLDDLDARYDRLWRTGIIEFKYGDWPASWRVHFRKLAKEWKRPALWLEPYAGGITVRIRKLNKLAPLAAPLILGGKPAPVSNQSFGIKEDDPLLQYKESLTSWTFFFKTGSHEYDYAAKGWVTHEYPDGRELLNQWLHQTQTNPEMRKALKLPEPE